MTRRLLPFVFLALQALLVNGAHAEKGDADKQIEVKSIHAEVDDVKQIRIYTGDVILTQGTLVLKGTKLVVTQSPDGWEFATLYAPKNALATMRQKRDGGPDLWVEGEAADRITYDQKTSLATLYTNAKVRRLTGTKTTDESQGAFLSYNSQTEYVTGSNNESGNSVQGAPRVITIIQPHHPAADTHPTDTKGQ